jgi:ABC-2 type transport system ATP-binding protein
VTANGAIASAEKLARWYGPVVGVTDVTLSIPSGIIGLLGPNGAGKSTLLKLLTGQIGPSSGTVSVLGRNPMTDPSVFRETGYCSEDDALFEDLTTTEMVNYLARLHGMGRAESRARAVAALEECGVGALAKRRCQELSKGQRQRVRIAAAIVHEPRLLILDEPMTGLDPIGRRAVLDLVRRRARAGRSVVFSSHILHEVESVAEYVIVLNKGMVLAEGTLQEIREALSDYAFTVEIAGANLAPLAERLVVRDHVTAIEWSGREVLKVSTQSARQLAAELPGLIVGLGVTVASLTTPDESLEVLFGKLISRRPS